MNLLSKTQTLRHGQKGRQWLRRQPAVHDKWPRLKVMLNRVRAIKIIADRLYRSTNFCTGISGIFRQVRWGSYQSVMRNI